MYRVKEVEIKNFRGFQNIQTFDTNKAEFIILKGDNGLGKTSFFDAIEWGLTGALKRYDSGSLERNSEIFMKNRFADGPGRVKITLSESDGQSQTIERSIMQKGSCDYNEGNLKVNSKSFNRINKLLLNHNKITSQEFDFNQAFNFSHFLGQEIISDFVRSYKDTERYSILNHLVGVGSYSKYRDRLSNMAKAVSNAKDKFNNKLIETTSQLESAEEKFKDGFKKDFNIEQEYNRIEKQFLNLKAEWKKKLSGLKIKNDKKYNYLKETIEKGQEKLNKYKIKLERRLNKIEKLLENQLTYQKSTKELAVLKDEIKITSDLLEAVKGIDMINYIKRNKDIESPIKKYNMKIAELKSKQNKREKWLEKYSDPNLESEDLFHLLFNENTKQESILKKLKDDKQRLSSLKKELADLNEKIDQIQDMKSQLIRTSLDYLKKNQKDYCPVCLQSISSEELINDLQERLNQNIDNMVEPYIEEKKDIKNEISITKVDIKDNQSLIEQELVEYKNHLLKDYEDRSEELEKWEKNREIRRTIRDYLGKLGLTVNDNIEEEIAVLHQNYNSILAGAEIDYKDHELLKEKLHNLEKETEKIDKNILEFQTRLKKLGADSFEELSKLSKENENKLIALKQDLQKFGKLKTDLIELISYLKSSKTKKKVERLRHQKTVLKNKISFLKTRYDKVKKIEKRVPDVVNDITAEILEAYREIANDIYSRINPHPLFTKFDWKRDSTGHNNGTLRLIIKSKDGRQEANPSYIYSSAQINIIVLSLFLSFALRQSWSRLDSIFLDDPIQSIDDINIFSFVDVLRAICLNPEEQKQIFLSTHDRKFYNFLQKKLRFFRVMTLDFKAFGRSGPQIEVKRNY